LAVRAATVGPAPGRADSLGQARGRIAATASSAALAGPPAARHATISDPPPIPLRLAPARGDHHRDLGDAELPGGKHASMARDQATVLTHHAGLVQPHSLMLAAIAATWADRGHLGVRVGAGIFGIRDQPLDPPALDLVGRPRSLISRRLSRACARARARAERGEVWALLRSSEPSQDLLSDDWVATTTILADRSRLTPSSLPSRASGFVQCALID
jgi:hypothetical protein